MAVFTQEGYENWQKKQAVKRAKMILQSPTVDVSFVKSYGENVNSFLSSAPDRYSGMKYGQSQGVLNNYKNEATKLKYQKVLIEDWLSKNAEAGSYDDILSSMNEAEKSITDVGNRLQERHNLFSQFKTEDEYITASTKSQFKNSTYDDILAEITRLGEEQKTQTAAEQKKTQKRRDVLNGLLYDSDYTDSDSYNKAIADLSRQIKAAQTELDNINSGKKTGLVAGSLWENDNKKRIAEIEEKMATAKLRLSELNRKSNLRDKENQKLAFGNTQDIPEFRAYSDKGATEFSVDLKGDLNDIVTSYNTERQKEGFNDQNMVAFYWALVDKYPELLKDGVSVKDIEKMPVGTEHYLDRFISDAKNGYVIPIKDENGNLKESVTVQISAMDKTQRDIYNYLYEMNGIDTANEYLATIANDLSEAKGKAEYEEVKDTSLEKYWYGFKSGVKQWETGFLELLSGMDDDYAVQDPSYYATQMIRKDLGSFGKFVLDLSQTSGNQIPAAAMSALVSAAGGKTLGAVSNSVLMGGSAAGSTYIDAVNMGYTKEQAKTYATLVGGSEAALEFLMDGFTKGGGVLTGHAIRKLSSKVASGIGKFALKLGGNMASEAAEEYLAEVLDTAWKNIAFDTEEDIEFFSGDAFYAALLGAVSAAGMGAANAFSEVNTDKARDELYKRTGDAKVLTKTNFEMARDELIDMGLSMSPDTRAYKLATELETKKKVESEQLQELSDEIYRSKAEENQKLFNSVRKSLVLAGETGDINAIASAAVNAITGVPLSKTEISLIAKSKLAQNFGFTGDTDDDVNSQVGFVGESSGIEYTVEQAEALADIPSDILNMAFGAAGDKRNDVKATTIGINPQSQFYKKLESAGLANSEGLIKGTAIRDEARRRAVAEQTKYAKQEESGDVTAEEGAINNSEEITVNMSEDERAKILRNKTVTPVEVGSEYSEDFDFENLKNNIKSKVEKALLKKFRELGFLKKYSSTAIGDIEFEFTGGGVRKSLNSQETSYGGTKADFAKASANLQKLLDNAILVETHTDKGMGTDKENARLKQVYVLLSVMRDGDSIIPVQFEVKQYVDNNNRLYLAVALTKIETSVVGDTASEQMRTRLLPVSNISIPDLFAKINPDDGKFLKYIPDEFLNDEQIASKRRAQKEDADKYGEPEQGGFTDVPDREIQRERTVDDENRDFATGKYRSPRQRQAEKIAELFGIKMWWDEKLTSPYYNFETHCIFMSPKMTISDMYAVMLKHELVHSFEFKKGYDGFKNYLFKNSSAFADYVQKKLARVTHGEFKGTNEEAIEAYIKYKYEQYKNSSEIPEGLRERFTIEMAEMEIVADFVGERLLFGKNVDKSMDALTELAQTDRNLFQRIWDWVKDKLKALRKRGDVQDASIIKDLEYLEKRLGRVWDSKDKKNSDTGVESKYKLKAGAEKDVDRVLSDIGFRDDVYLTETSPSIIVHQRGVRNLPMLMKASHIRENILTEIEAQKLGLKVDQHTHYHGLGKDLYLKVIEGLDDVTLAYRGTKNADDSSRRENYFLLISQHKDAQGNIINIPVYINEKGQYNRVFIDTNKIATVFGRDNFSTYIKNEVEKGNLVRIKNKSSQVSERTALIAGGYNSNAHIDIIQQNNADVNSNSMQKTEKNAESGENSKHYLGFRIDENGEFDYSAPKRPSVNNRADRLTKRFGKYETGVEGLKSDLTKMLELAGDNDIIGAVSLAQEMSKRFKGVDGNAVNTDAVLRYLNNAVISQQIEYSVYRGMRSIEKENKSLQAKLEQRDKRIKELEGKEFNSHRYHEQMEKKRIDREDRAKNLKHFRSIYNRLNTRLQANLKTSRLVLCIICILCILLFRYIWVRDNSVLG